MVAGMNIADNVTDKKYTLVIRGEVTLNWDNLEYLEEALITLPSTYGTYIQYNETGIKEYQEKAA
jgi:glycine cleavage system regulatory protein